ncbi:hypothetical protein OV203_37110 [Nannocystis sp. ILAH1]|uniref:hypothetical protein n=1 Tax=Nannocystis sp. ILAH1 TaxID=2996789 RepID=UPI002271CBC3|nr:hypothetical protein [Nannocystis sp. ILAH1]MCY0992820.1 hypothetical protein [Nannocystis sp. ILAH1]
MARRRKPADSPARKPGDGGAVLLSGAGAIGPVGSGGRAAGVALDVDRELVVLVDARVLVDVARRAVLAEAREQLYAGKRPDGGPQRPLIARHAADPRRVSDKRGVRTGHMADELRATPIKGDTGRAESTIAVPTDRNVFIATEAKRGVRYLGIGPAHAAAAERAMGEAIAAMVAGKRVEPEQGEPVAREESTP